MTAAATLMNATVLPRVIGCDVGKKTITVFDMATSRTAIPGRKRLRFNPDISVRPDGAYHQWREVPPR